MALFTRVFVGEGHRASVGDAIGKDVTEKGVAI
jgi:hypothetical protein